MSERSVAQKLLIREGQRVAVVDPPAAGRALLGMLPPGVAVQASPSAEADVVILFVRDRAALEAGWPGVAAVLRPSTVLWFAYPKRGHGVATDLTRDHGWAPVHGPATTRSPRSPSTTHGPPCAGAAIRRSGPLARRAEPGWARTEAACGPAAVDAPRWRDGR
jgi:hypothetical protein